MGLITPYGMTMVLWRLGRLPRRLRPALHRFECRLRLIKPRCPILMKSFHTKLLNSEPQHVLDCNAARRKVELGGDHSARRKLAGSANMQMGIDRITSTFRMPVVRDVFLLCLILKRVMVFSRADLPIALLPRILNQTERNRRTERHVHRWMLQTHWIIVVEQ